MKYTQKIEQDFAKLWLRAYDNYKAVVFDCSLYNLPHPQKGYIVLDCIRIAEDSKRQGYGSSIMTMLCKYADSYKLPIYLQPDDIFGTPLDVLNRFYEGFGFKKSWLGKTPQECKKYLFRREPINEYICKEFIKQAKRNGKEKNVRVGRA